MALFFSERRLHDQLPLYANVLSEKEILHIHSLCRYMGPDTC